MSRNAIVKGIATGDIVAIRTAGLDNNGTLCSNETNTEQMIDFSSDSDGLQFATDIAGVGAGYSVFVWDVPPLLRQMKTAGFTA